jgi:hypothetical protein
VPFSVPRTLARTGHVHGWFNLLEVLVNDDGMGRAISIAPTAPVRWTTSPGVDSACVRGGPEPHAWDISRIRGDHALTTAQSEGTCIAGTATSRAKHRRLMPAVVASASVPQTSPRASILA